MNEANRIVHLQQRIKTRLYNAQQVRHHQCLFFNKNYYSTSKAHSIISYIHCDIQVQQNMSRKFFKRFAKITKLNKNLRVEAAELSSLCVRTKCRYGWRMGG